MKRGEIWTVAGGPYASKPRPCVILQSDSFAETDSVVVVLLTHTAVDAPLLRVRIPATPRNGLQELSFAMVDKVYAAQRTAVQTRLGQLTPPELSDIEGRLLVFLGLSR
jgi:mRNA interferase MazF